MRKFNKKAQVSRTTILIMLVVYMIGITTFLYYIGDTYGDIGVTSSTQGLSNSGGFIINLITGISILPLWCNLLFLALPVAIIIYLIAVSFIPTINAGN